MCLNSVGRPIRRQTMPTFVIILHIPMPPDYPPFRGGPALPEWEEARVAESVKRFRSVRMLGMCGRNGFASPLQTCDVLPNRQPDHSPGTITFTFVSCFHQSGPSASTSLSYAIKACCMRAKTSGNCLERSAVSLGSSLRLYNSNAV